MNPDEFESKVFRLLDQELSPEEFAELEKYLISTPEAIPRYLQCVDIHSLLGLEFDLPEPVQPGVSNILDVKDILRRQKLQILKVSAFAAAAVVLISLLVLRLVSAGDTKPTLIFETSPGSDFTLTHSKMENTTEGAILEKGSRLHIERGFVEFTFGSGVRSVVIAPAEVYLVDDDILFLKEGSAWFHVPKEAIGFNVVTPELDVVDLGTEFGVLSNPDGLDEVHVFKGKVKVGASRARRDVKTLVAGQARRIDPIGLLGEIPPKSSLFVTVLPRESPSIVFEDQFNEVLPALTKTGVFRHTAGDYPTGGSPINTVGEIEHPGIHFDRMGREIPAIGEGFLAIGSSGSAPVNTVTTKFPVSHGKLYTVYFRYAGSHYDGQRITAKVTIGADTVSTGSLPASHKEWASHSFVFTPKATGSAVLTFDDTDSMDHRFSDLLLDSILVTSIPILPHQGSGEVTTDFTAEFLQPKKEKIK